MSRFGGRQVKSREGQNEIEAKLTESSILRTVWVNVVVRGEFKRRAIVAPKTFDA
jgi:hypothetical protein